MCFLITLIVSPTLNIIQSKGKNNDILRIFFKNAETADLGNLLLLRDTSSNFKNFCLFYVINVLIFMSENNF